MAPTEGYEDAIVVPAITADNFVLKHGLLTLVQNKQFFGHDKEDPHAHIHYFNKIASTLKFPNVPNTSIKLMLFPFSLEAEILPSFVEEFVAEDEGLEGGFAGNWLWDGWKDKKVSDADGNLTITTERVFETYKNVKQDIRDQLNAEAEAVQIIFKEIDNDIYSTVDDCLNACEMWKAIERLKQ
nr:reverse transcriptase domain-containing protein [Tanacetum cinerariifolium]